MVSNFKKTPWHSFVSGKVCKGCEQCVRGKKTVLFITGLCSRKCFYCPISSKKYAHDVVFANEWEVKDFDDPVELFEEIRLTGAEGAGITGGDPLLKLDRTCNYIKSLKKEFSSSFHIHLYTSLDFVSLKSLELLSSAGLDEIRFHPSFDDDKLWDRIFLAKNFGFDVGVEIPVVSNKKVQTFNLLDFLKGKIDFINLNELEFSDTDTNHYDMSGFEKINNESYAVKGSKELAFELLDKCAELNIDAHFCTAKLKNQVQVGERLKRRAFNVASHIDELTEEYLLFRGAIYLKGFEPGYNYGQGKNVVPDERGLLDARVALVESGFFDEEDLILDVQRNRLLSHFSLVESHAQKIKDLGFVPALVEEYPSSDYFCVELEFL